MNATETSLRLGSNGEPGAGRLHVLHVLAPAPAGGLESVVRQLASEQARTGMAVHVCVVLTPADTQPHPFIEAARADGIDVRMVVIGSRAYVAEFRAVRRLCEELSIDVVHTHGFRPDVVDAAAARSVGAATVSTVHGFTANGVRGRLYEAVQCRMLARADAVVAVSPQQVGRLHRAGVRPERVHVIPNAMAPLYAHLPREEARRQLGLPGDAFVAGWVGRLGYEKGPDVMAAAAGTLVPAGVHVSILGDGPLREPLERALRAAGVAEGVSWHGRVAEAARYLKAFDVFVLSSRTEGTPMALLEAMSAGVPVVVTAVGGVPYVVGVSEAVLVPSGHPEGLAAAVLSVRDDPAGAAERAGRARDRLAECHSVGPWVRRYEEIYAGALASAALSGRRPTRPVPATR